MTDSGPPPQLPPPQERRESSSSGDTSIASAPSVMERRTSQGTASDDAPTAASGEYREGDIKRAAAAAPSDARDTRRARLSDLALETPPIGPLAGDAAREFICLCTPAPKVPRPRNAQVVSQHPGLANPEISKIIGEQWRQQPDNIKDGWKKLAEEEKVNHQRQYPDYRYQPRRGQRPTGRPGSAAGDDPGRCPRCGGRFISTPRTPSTPLLTPTAARPSMNPFQPRDGRGYEGESSRHALPQGKHMNPYAQSNLRDMDEDFDPMSPAVDAKRRRFNMPGHYQGMPSPNPYQGHPPPRHTRQSSMAGPSGAGPGYGPAPLPSPSGLGRQGQGPMAPPPRPPHQQHFQPSGRNPGYDESLRLPPLQTQMGPQTPNSQGESDRPSANPLGLGISNPQDSQARSIEAMVMTISFQSKLNVLRKISPPLSPPGPTSPHVDTRGAVIAIEGPDERLLEQVGTILQRALSEAKGIDLQCWRDGTDAPKVEESTAGGSSSAGSSRKSSFEGVAPSDMYVDYMQKLVQWHNKSKQIVRYITTRSDGPPLSRRASDGEEGAPRAGSSSPARIPVALLTGGYSSTISDKYACRVPIVDSYAPIDHWQWMATLWRGIVGPDLVLYVKPSVEEEVAHYGAVEYKGPGVMLVRITPNKGLDERGERRMCFEVDEWLRGGSFKEGFGLG
ncbi:hypothetical protein ACHAQA_003437 [Verticillium albo-atrum]